MKTPPLIIVALFMSVIPAAAEVPDCYERADFEKTYDDGLTNKSGSMYNLAMIRHWTYEKVQEMDDAERRKARALVSIASVIGPCLRPDGAVFHMVDRPRSQELARCALCERKGLKHDCFKGAIVFGDWLIVSFYDWRSPRSRQSAWV